MRLARWAIVGLAIVSFLIPSVALADSGSRYFTPTGHRVSRDFLSFFDQHGGLDVFGYPRTELLVAQGRSIQYFQRARLESWPENSPAFKVQLALLGDAVMGPGDPPIPPESIPAPGDPGRTYFPQTGHTLSGAFRDFFRSRGDLAIFGYPTSEPYPGPSGFLIQRFQRARFEYHSELPPEYQVSMGLLGDEYIFVQGKVPFGATAPVPETSPTPTQSVASSGTFVYQTRPGGALIVSNADGTGAHQIGQGYDPAWSPGGSQIAFAVWGSNPGIYVASSDGSSPHAVFSSPDARSPQWSPDGTQIAFYHRIDGWVRSAGGLDRQDWFQVVVVRLKDQSTWLPPDQPAHAYSPSWSPDSRTLVFSGDGGLYLGGESVSARAIPNTNFQDTTPAWSPRGNRIVFTAWNHDHWDIALINSDGSGLSFLTAGGDVGSSTVSSAAATWSPPGDRIAFVSDRGGGSWNLYVMNLDGSNVVPVGTATLTYTGSNDRVVAWKT